jgi:hypothetical protein
MPRKRGASQFIGLNRHRVTATDLKSRLAERDRRQLADNRTPAQKWLNDPPADRSALRQRSVSGAINDLIASLARLP